MVKKTKTDTASAYIAASIICERFLKEGDDVASAIRIVDTITLPFDPNIKKGMAIKLPLQLYLLIRAGTFVGNKQMHLDLIKPSKKKLSKFAGAMMAFKGRAEGGAQGILPVIIEWESEGIYSYDVLVDGKVIGHIPLKVVVGQAPRPEDEQSKKGK